MSKIKRVYQHGGTYFITVVIADRANALLTTNIDLLKQSITRTRKTHRFKLIALCVLPDHFHMLVTLPENEADISTRVRLIKFEFTRSLNSLELQTSPVWQPRFWDHLIRDEADLHQHINYIHHNPVKHKLVNQAVDWPYSTFHRFVEKGVYEPNWDSVDVDLDYSRA